MYRPHGHPWAMPDWQMLCSAYGPLPRKSRENGSTRMKMATLVLWSSPLLYTARTQWTCELWVHSKHWPSTSLIYCAPSMSVSRKLNVSQAGVTKQCWVTIRRLMICTCRPCIKTRLLFPSPTTKISRIQRFIIQLLAQNYKKSSCCWRQHYAVRHRWCFAVAGPLTWRCQTVFATQHWVSTYLDVSWWRTFLGNIDEMYSAR